jgi:hypothetical protein
LQTPKHVNSASTIPLVRLILLGNRWTFVAQIASCMHSTAEQPRLSHPQFLSAGSNVQSPNRRDRPSVFLLTPGMIISDSPKDNHEKDQDGPIEVRGIWVGCNGEEHEDE